LIALLSKHLLKQAFFEGLGVGEIADFLKILGGINKEK